MSETSANKSANPARRGGLFVILAALGLLVLGYLGGFFILPRSLQSAYQGRDCDTVLSRHELYRAVYPAFVQDKSLENQALECAVYTLAARAEQNGDRDAAYEAYRVYAETYPNGLFAQEATAQSAGLLTGLAQEQLSAGRYPEALGTLDLAASKSGAEAEGMYGEVYQAWGVELREAGDYASAERIFEDFRAWAQARQFTDQAAAAQRELAQTYLAWGLALQSQGRFEEALTQFERAAATDPEPGSAAGQVEANRAEFLRAWGDHLIEQKDFAGGMERYEAAAALSGSGEAAVQDSLAGGYVQWAAGAGADGDFPGALVLLDFAQARAASEATRTRVEATRSELYAAFSQSGGEQARQALQQAVRIVCGHQAPPRLPIFGLDQGNVRVGVSGVEEPLPEALAATTPGSLHYVACVEEENRLIQTLRLPISTTQFGLGPGIVHIDYRNYQYVWNVVLRKAGTGEEVATTVIEGTKPAPLGPWDIAITTFSYYGPKPDIASLADWIAETIR